MLGKQHTRDLLFNSILELMAYSSIEELSVTQITQNCGVSQRTFYNHFRDKYDLANQVCAHAKNMLVNEKFHVESISEAVLYFSRYTQEETRKSFFVNAVKYLGQNSFLDMFQETMENLMLMVVHQKTPEPSEDILFAVHFFACGFARDSKTVSLKSG